MTSELKYHSKITFLNDILNVTTHYDVYSVRQLVENKTFNEIGKMTNLNLSEINSTTLEIAIPEKVSKDYAEYKLLEITKNIQNIRSTEAYTNINNQLFTTNAQDFLYNMLSSLKDFEPFEDNFNKVNDFNKGFNKTLKEEVTNTADKNILSNYIENSVVRKMSNQVRLQDQ